MSLLAVLVLVTPVVVMVLLDFWRSRPRRQPRVDQASVELYAVRRRFDVALFKFQLDRDTTDARRAMDAELHKFDLD